MFYTLNKDSFSPVANIESSSVTGPMLKRQIHRTFKLFVVFTLTLKATVLKVIRIFLYQPVDNDKLVFLTLLSLSLPANQ